jgi:hypothetical protein
MQLKRNQHLRFEAIIFIPGWPAAFIPKPMDVEWESICSPRLWPKTNTSGLKALIFIPG